MTCLLRSPLPLPSPETRLYTKGHQTLNSDFKKGISKVDIRRTADRAVATQPIIELPTRTRAKGAPVGSEAIPMNLRMIETGSQAVHNDPLIHLFAATTRGLGPHLRIDPARPPPSIAYPHVPTSPHTTCGERLGIGAETTILVISLVIDTTVQTTRRRIVMTAPKEIHGGHHTITGPGLLPPIRLDLLEWIMLQLLLALLMMHRTVSIPLHRHPQTRLPHPLRNDPCLQSINRYLSPFLQKSQSLPSSLGPLHRLILLRPPELSQSLTQEPPISLPNRQRNVRNGRDALVRKRSWLTTAPSQDVAQSTIMTSRPNWGKERLGKRFTLTRRFPLTLFFFFLARCIKRSKKPQERSSP